MSAVEIVIFISIMLILAILVITIIYNYYAKVYNMNIDKHIKETQEKNKDVWVNAFFESVKEFNQKLNGSSQTLNQIKQMPMYEYLIKMVEYQSAYTTDWMNELGKQGWELVCVINEPGNKDLLRYYFKKYL